MAKRTTADTVRADALEALGPVLLDPSPRVLYGSKTQPGIVPNGSAKKWQAAAKYATGEGWIRRTGEKTGNKGKEKDLYEITSEGAQAVRENTEEVVLLRAIAERLDTVERLRRELDGLRKSVGPIGELVGSLAERLVADPSAGDSAAPSETSGGADDCAGRAEPWLDDADRIVGNRGHDDAITLPELYGRLKKTHTLTLGQFHDGLRRLVGQRAIELIGYTRGYHRIAREPAALFLDGEVMYFADRVADGATTRRGSRSSDHGVVAGA